MFKIILIIFTILISSNLNAKDLIFTSEELKYIKTHEFSVAVLPDFPPFNIYEKNKFSGLSNDILKLLRKKHGIKFKYEIDTWPNNLKKFKEKKVDIIDAISFRKERLEFTSFTKPYYEIPLVIFARKDLTNYTNIFDLKGKKLGLTKDIFYYNEINDLNIFEIKFYNQLSEKLKALAFGEIDVLFGHLLSMQNIIIKEGFTNLKALGELDIANIKKTDLRYGIQKDNKILYSIIDKSIENISPKEWSELYAKWITEINTKLIPLEMDKTLNLTKEEKEYISNKRVLKVHNEKNWPPYNFNENGVAKGFSIDYTNLLAKKLNMDVEYVYGYSWDEFLELLKNKEIDIINNISKNKQREEYIDFTDIFHTAANAIYVKNGSENLDSLEKLKNKTIIMPKGFFAQQLIEKYYPEINQILVKDSLEALRQLSLGKADATIGKKNVLDYIISTNNISGVTATNFVDDNRLVSLIRMGIPKGEKELQSILQKAQDSVSDEELLTLKRKWFGEQSFTKKNETFLTNKEKIYLKEKKEIRYCMNYDINPISFLEDNKPMGISIDILENFKNSLDISFKYIPTNSFKQSVEFLNKKRCDIIPTIENNDILLEGINTTYPYLTYKLAIITRKNIPVVPSLEDIIDKPIALKNDSQLISEFKSVFPDINIIKTENYHKSLESVNNNKAYFTLAPLPIASYYMAEYAMSDLYISRYTNLTYNINMAVSNSEPILFDILNKSIKNLSQKDKREIISKWSTNGIKEKFDYDLFWKITFLIFIVFVVIIYRQIVLNRHNNELKKANNEIALLKNSLEDKIVEEIQKNEQKTKQLIQQSRLAQMGELINMIAHQWRQPLTAISATINNLSLKMILGKEIDKEVLEKELSLINDYAQYLSGTIDDFRNFYKKEKVKKLVTIENVVEQAINIIKPSLSSNLIDLKLNFDSYEKVKTYSTEINHVVLNILKNAEDVLIENKIEKPTINIRTYKDEKNIFLEIENNGKQIEERNLNKIFEPYFSTRLTKDGTGLGLYMSKVIIEEHCKGLLNVENSKNGVIFKISIPKD